MLLDQCYASSLSLLPSSLKKFLEEGGPCDLFLSRPGARPLRIWPKTSTLVRDHEYFIPTNFHQNSSSSSGEEVENMNSLRTTDGRRAMTIAHLSLRVRWAKSHKSRSDFSVRPVQVSKKSIIWKKILPHTYRSIRVNSVDMGSRKHFRRCRKWLLQYRKNHQHQTLQTYQPRDPKTWCPNIQFRCRTTFKDK